MNHIIKKITAGIVICAVFLMMLGNESIAKANASKEDKQNENGTVLKVKEKKNNKKNKNQGNHSGKSWNQKMIQVKGFVDEVKEVSVAIIDSGVNFSEDINVVERKNFIEEDDECSILYEDFSDHGTAVAGIIGALDNDEGITGVNPNVRIYSARVLDDDLQAPVERIIAAVEWAMEKDVSIINMSLGIYADVPELHQVVKDAYAQGILLVAAVGNDGSITYPAAYEEVIAVASVDSSGESVQGDVAGRIVELVAPGENILASAIFDGVMGGSGTSLATAHVTGVASVLMEMNPDMPAEFIRALMDYSANLYGDKEMYGNGVVDLDYAISIAPDFKKVYEKYLRKSNQNEVQRKKQQEKFWGEIVKTVPQNEKAVEVFEDVENVVGLWSRNNHELLADNANSQVSYSLSADEMKFIKKGCRYPDEADALAGMNANPYHGYVFRDNTNGNIGAFSNYLANYVFLTRLAINKGLIASLSSVSGMDSIDRNRMNADFANGRLGGADYTTIWNELSLNNNSVSEEGRKKELFIYGIAMHSVADIYAHSTWKKGAGDIKAVRITHTKVTDGNGNTVNCDSTSVYPKRYSSALQVMKNVLYRAYSSTEGTIEDFVIPKSNYGTLPENRFYLYKFVDYAKSVDLLTYLSWTAAYQGCAELESYQWADLISNFSAAQCNLEGIQ